MNKSKPTNRKSIAQLLHETACEVMRIDEPWAEVTPLTKRDYARIARIVTKAIRARYK